MKTFEVGQPVKIKKAPKNATDMAWTVGKTGIITDVTCDRVKEFYVVFDGQDEDAGRWFTASCLTKTEPKVSEVWVESEHPRTLLLEDSTIPVNQEFMRILEESSAWLIERRIEIRSFDYTTEWKGNHNHRYELFIVGKRLESQEEKEKREKAEKALEESEKAHLKALLAKYGPL